MTLALRHLVKQFDLPTAIRWIVLTVWMAIFLTYLLQTEAAPVLATGIPPGPYSPERDAFFSTLHLLAYTMTTMLWMWALIAFLPLKRARRVTFVVVLSMGFLTELLQTLTPDRHFQLIDLAANTGGLILGLFAFNVIYRWYEQQNLSEGIEFVEETTHRSHTR
jgi:VanZ family protein